MKPALMIIVIAILGLVALAAAAVVLDDADTLVQEPQDAASALGVRLETSTLADVEDAFWVCDYMATIGKADQVTTCAAVYDALKARKFGGDFDKLLLWWEQNKVAQHAKLDAGDRTR
jgi:hypothetical protein